MSEPLLEIRGVSSEADLVRAGIGGTSKGGLATTNNETEVSPRV